MGQLIYLTCVCLITFAMGFTSTVQAGYNFYSQASQDAFVHILVNDIEKKKDVGCYLEIGSAHPVNINNTYFFEKNYNWKGISIDLAIEYKAPWSGIRQNPLLTEDATKVDYYSILKSFPNIIDYLSLDVDGNYDTVLERLPFNEHTFKIITIEHDFYRFGDYYRKREREILTSFGYYLLCPDVCHPRVGSFEDWWIHPRAFSKEIFVELASLDLKQKYHN